MILKEFTSFTTERQCSHCKKVTGFPYECCPSCGNIKPGRYHWYKRVVVKHTKTFHLLFYCIPWFTTKTELIKEKTDTLVHTYYNTNTSSFPVWTKIKD